MISWGRDGEICFCYIGQFPLILSSLRFLNLWNWIFLREKRGQVWSDFIFLIYESSLSVGFHGVIFTRMNLRTYVRDKEGRRGVWFHSLDSTDLFAVLGARLLYGLNYRWAEICQSKMKNSISYQSCTRSLVEKIPAELHVELSNPTNEATIANEPIDQFLLERLQILGGTKMGRCY